MPYTSPLEIAAATAAAKVRSQITRTTHDRYPWLFISPTSKADVRPVVECLLEVRIVPAYGNGNTKSAIRIKLGYKQFPTKQTYRLVIIHGTLWQTITRLSGLKRQGG
jgi:hypothetical protein